MSTVEHTILDRDNPAIGNLITPVQALALQDLAWIEWVDSNADGSQQFYNRTSLSEEYGTYVSDLTAALEQDFADVLAAAALAVKPAPFKNTPRAEVGDVTENDLMAAVLAIFPDAEIDMDNEGQIIVYSGLVAVPGVDNLRGRFVKPQPALGPAPEGRTRLMVLDDGVTFSALEGCKIVEVSDNDADTKDDVGQMDFSFLTHFNEHGLEV